MSNNPDFGTDKYRDPNTRSKSKLRDVKQHTISLGGTDERFLKEIMEILGCGKAEAVRTAIRVYAAILSQSKR